MATFNKFNSFVDNLVKGANNLSADTIKIMLTDTAPVATNTVKSNITEIAAGNGYTAGGATTTVGVSNSSGTETVTATSVTFTASGGSIAQWRYAVVYDSTTNNLIGWYDAGAEINIASGNAETITFASGLFTLA